MDSEPVYLRVDVEIEPLIHHWYAWSYLMSPATAAMYLRNAQLPILQSFVSSPEVHASALRNPALRNGPYIDHPPSRAGEVRALLDQLRRDRSRLIKLAEDIAALEALLASEARGGSMEPLYPRIPPGLRGLVELVYDAAHRPAARLFEALLYHSEYHDHAGQALSLSFAATGRPFCFGTPRLASAAEVHLHTPFAAPGLDPLYRMRFEPAPLGAVAEQLGVGASERSSLAQYFTPTPPARPQYQPTDQLRVRYFGHACVLIEAPGVAILTDPIVTHRCDGPPHFSFADLPPRIDHVVITHNHQDHCVLETLLELRHRVDTIIVPRCGAGDLADVSLKLALQDAGFARVRELDHLETIELSGGEIRAIPFLGEHCDMNIRGKAGYFVRLGRRSILLLADSNNLDPELYRRVHAVTGDAEIVFIGMECEGASLSWLYGPLIAKPLARALEQTRRLSGSDAERAWAVVRQFGAHHAYVYAMGQERWMQKFMVMNYSDTSRQITESNDFLDRCRAKDITAARPYCMLELQLPLS